ncbi:hypothetical protein B0I72DRAFT_140010 [Yarrowia lipolytica]|uniref:YALI0E23221p n=2 Tax=Yarrowia lipolytica TaxID=4952 RepID=Q6C4W3_YARLI|nr:YALI0E23221p [Yarrowia lipolytica CLIB122]RDW24100.1 hypothetical protein B0I71DRAFT_134809 [Yarrowia lipolytica]RDW31354.1 hypothetical protein B0I72DRAFT_140010 [Yarrowia lipolytica]RDW40657.1 hypothetical protein B0I73DRAFT_129956 [Yarrowia lipolytica]RDW49043.1 hypothetical protein B0I74DRAFT_132386 [Yarrowia lipolytica]RDW56067.1 hypothetical protein B0I75DRAFT_132086 [Yarrowia lipolytica]|eukprot:XP_504299.1 YALI0E23221p [Yarrowia lipolytica CLIB122]
MTTIERPCDYYPFCHQFEQVDRAIENLVKSGQLYNQHSNNHNHNNHSYGRYQQTNPQSKYRKSPQTQYYYDKGVASHQQQQQYVPQQPQQHRKNYYYSPQLGSQVPPNNVPHVSLTNSAAPIPVAQPPQSIQIPSHSHPAPQAYRSQSYSFQGHSRLGSVGSVGSMTSPALVATSSMTPVLQPTPGPFTKTQRPRGDRDVNDFDEVDSAIKGLGDMSLELDEIDDREDFGSKSFDKKPFESSATSSPISFTFDPFAGLGIGSSSKNDTTSCNNANTPTATTTTTTDNNDKEKKSPPSVFAPIGTKPDTLASSQRPWPKKSSLGMSTTTVWG